MIHQDFLKNAMQAYIKYKAYYDIKANASKLKEADYVYVLQPEADHQGSKILFTEFRWLGPYIIGKVLPNKQFSGMQNWHQQDASDSPYTNAPVHTLPTPSRHTNLTTRI